MKLPVRIEASGFSNALVDADHERIATIYDADHADLDAIVTSINATTPKEPTLVETKTKTTTKTTTSTFDPTKPVQTRDGRKARILCVDRLVGDDETSQGLHPEPIVALVTSHDGSYEYTETFSADGHWLDDGDASDDLVNVPESKWLNVYDPKAEDFTAIWHNSRELADRFAAGSRIGVLELNPETKASTYHPV